MLKKRREHKCYKRHTDIDDYFSLFILSISHKYYYKHTASIGLSPISTQPKKKDYPLSFQHQLEHSCENHMSPMEPNKRFLELLAKKSSTVFVCVQNIVSTSNKVTLDNVNIIIHLRLSPISSTGCLTSQN